MSVCVCVSIWSRAGGLLTSCSLAFRAVRWAVTHYFATCFQIIFVFTHLYSFSHFHLESLLICYELFKLSRLWLFHLKKYSSNWYMKLFKGFNETCVCMCVFVLVLVLVLVLEMEAYCSTHMLKICTRFQNRAGIVYVCVYVYVCVSVCVCIVYVLLRNHFYLLLTHAALYFVLRYCISKDATQCMLCI